MARADQKYRISISGAFWAEDPVTLQSLIETITNLVPEEDREQILPTIEFFPDGRPESASMVVPDPDAPTGED